MTRATLGKTRNRVAAIDSLLARARSTRSGAAVFIDGEMTGTGSIDLTGDGVGLNSQFHVDSAATGAVILNGGLVDGDVRLATAISDGFAGTATFTGVSDQVAGKGQILIYATGTPTDGLSGTVHITTGTMAGVIASSWTRDGGLIDIDNDCTGTLDIGMIRKGGDINIDGNLTSTGFIDIDGNVDDGGAITIDGDADGDITIGAGLDGDITILGTLDGALDIAQGTGVNSLIHCLGGLGSNGSIVVASVATADANGDMAFGPTVEPLSLGNLTFDGCVEIGHGADLEGDITLIGCLSIDPLICVSGNTNGTITLTQTGCTPGNYVVDSSCPTCP